MGRRTWVIVAVVIALVAGVLLVAVWQKPQGGVTIGRILPLTGPAASYGKSEQKGTLLALEEVNAAGGIGGKTLDILFEDSQCNVKDGVNAMKKLVEIHDVPAVLGATISGVTLAVAPIANERKVLLLSPLSSAAAITNAGPFVFRVMPSDAFQSAILAEWILAEGHKKVAVLGIDNAWGKGVAEEFARSFTGAGGTIVLKETCREGDRDFRVQVMKIRAAAPSALFCPTMPKEGGIILRQMKELGVSLPVYGADAWSVEELLTGAADASEGVMYTYPAQFTGEAYQSFASRFRAQYGEDPDVNAAGAYDAVKILASCMSKVAEAGLPLIGENIRQEMAKVRGYQGATGTTTFDNNGDSIAKTYDNMVIREGKRVQYAR